MHASGRAEPGMARRKAPRRLSILREALLHRVDRAGLFLLDRTRAAFPT